MCAAFDVIGLISSTPRHWTGRTSPKWSSLCWVWHKTLR